MEMFVLFGTSHIIMILIGVISVLLLIILGFLIRPQLLAKWISVSVLVIKLAEMYYRHRVLGEEIYRMLPFHLCNLTIILSLFMMFFHSKFLFQLVYFWFVGAIFAILTPDIIFAYPNFWTISFFITHFYLVFSALFALIHFHFRPTKRGMLMAFLFINLWAVLMYFVNQELGTNYLFVNRIPETTTLLSYFGAWPYYLLPVEGIYIIESILLYLPFRKSNIKFHF
ncbi:YwaF family protein [Fusobacterium necrophorum]|uniref:YwaF family protein n=1 Tax=Fusobacterium necrophorum TaxID=859 RepID=UPI0004843215|nr:TIGR02206 family membrane protein [Fusobacterium necrophorum]